MYANVKTSAIIKMARYVSHFNKRMFRRSILHIICIKFAYHCFSSCACGIVYIQQLTTSSPSRAVMGSHHSTDNSRLTDERARNLYITCDGYKELSGSFGPYKVFELTVSHQRYTWKIYKRYNELISLHNKCKGVLQEQGHNIHPPKSKMKLVWNRHNAKILVKRGEETAKYLENLGTIEVLWNSKELMDFLEISKVSISLYMT